jgi:hypothetical protein
MIGGINMALQIAFIGYSAEQTRRHFDEFAWENRDQIAVYRKPDFIKLHDGTVIRAVTSRDALRGRRFDQVIVVDARWNWVKPEWFAELNWRMSVSPVPEELRWQSYDL